MLLMKTCNTWSAIALATPALWAMIRIDFTCASGLSRLLPMRSRRAKNHHPLSITLGGDISYLSSRVSAVIWNYLWRAVETPQDLRKGTSLCGHDTTLGPLPLLETLVIRTEEDNRAPFLTSSATKFSIYHSTLHMRPIDNFPPWEKPIVRAPCLRRLAARGCDRDGHVLDCLSLPALETLSVQMGEYLTSGYATSLSLSISTTASKTRSEHHLVLRHASDCSNALSILIPTHPHATPTRTVPPETGPCSLSWAGSHSLPPN
ncbi:hypothetical protein B0H14DRAFT_3853740 [Mycena olivaceomarginata]|nr:hypothetical protein B0H14DRAFT_3853740 [Mycena olivaceomarginata]